MISVQEQTTMKPSVDVQSKRAAGANHAEAEISVIIPTYQEERYIGKTLSALTAAQICFESKRGKSEIIVVDGGTDRTPQIARQFTKNVFKLDHDGVSRARNLGARQAHGEILVFVDADVVVPPEIMEEIQETFRDKSVSAAVTYVFPERDRRVAGSRKLFFRLDVFFIERIVALSKAFLKFYTRGDLIALRHKAFTTIGGFNEDLHVMEITDLLERLSRTGEVRVLHVPVYESGRRITRYGLIKNYMIWIRNFVSYLVLRRPYSTTWEPVR